MRRKVTKEQIEEMRRLRKEGLTYKEIAKMFGVSEETPRYYCNHERQLELRREYRRRLPKEKKREQIKKISEWILQKYKEDEGFRRRFIESVRKYQRKIAARNNKIEARRVRCPRCGHEWSPRKKRVPGLCPKCKGLLVTFEVLE